MHGKPIRVTSSKHTTVQLPKEGAPDGGLTKDFANSPLHRFKKPGSKNYANVFPPSATLHLSNIPPDVEEETLVEAFSRHGHVKGGRLGERVESLGSWSCMFGIVVECHSLLRVVGRSEIFFCCERFLGSGPEGDEVL